MGERVDTRFGLRRAVVLALIAGIGFLAVRRVAGPAAARYRLERIDRGPIRSEVTAPGTVSAAMTRDLSRVQVRAAVSETDFGRIAVGEAATLRFRTCPECVSTGTVSEVAASPRANENPGGDKVVVEADNHDHKLLLGMAATVSIEVARRDGVLRLPEGALRFVPTEMEATTPTDPHVGRVFVLDHGAPRPVRVTVGLADPRRAELVAGPLREGDEVIVDRVR